MDPRTVRKHSEIEGIKTYFFAPLFKYILENERAMVENPSELNQFATFVLGLTDQFPTTDDFLNILVGSDNPTKAVMVPAIDVLLCFGSDFFHIAKQIATRLGEKGMRHEVVSCRLCAKDEKSFPGDLSKLVGKTLMRKTEGSYLLKLLHSIIKANSESERNYAFSELCAADLDWDAYVFLKLFTFGSQAKKEEIVLVRDNIIAKFEGKHSDLVKLWINGNDSEIQLLRKLIKPVSDIMESVFPSIIEHLLQIVDCQKDEEMSQFNSMTSQIHYIIIRAMITGDRNLAKEIHTKIPVSIKSIMFPGIIRTTIQTSITLVTYFLQFFVAIPESSRLKFSDVEKDGLYEILSNPWKKDALYKLLIDYKSSFTKDVFGFSVNLQEFDQITVIFALEFCMEIVSNFDGYLKFHWLNSDYKERIIKTLKEESFSTQIAAEFISSIICGLENSANFFTSTPTNANKHFENQPAGLNSDEVEETKSFVDIGKGVFVSARDVRPDDFLVGGQLVIANSPRINFQGPSACFFGVSTSR